MVSDFRLLQLKKANASIFVTLLGMVTLLMLLSLIPSRTVPVSSNMRMLSFMAELISVATKV